MNYTQNNDIQIYGLSNINESLSCHFLIYKIINLSTGQYYIGQHETNNPLDDYMGSGKYLIRAQEMYGISCFSKNILFDYSNFDDMNNKEQEMVQLSDCYPHNPMSYNLKEGGRNGQLSEQSKLKISETHKQLSISLGENNPMYGKNWKDYCTTEQISSHNFKIMLSMLGNAHTQDFKKNNPIGYEQWKSNIGKRQKQIAANRTVEQRENIKHKKQYTWSTKPQEERDRLFLQHSKDMQNRSQEQREQSKQKYNNTIKNNNTDLSQIRRNVFNNLTEEEKEIQIERCRNTINNLSDERYKKFVDGCRKRGIENNGMTGEKLKDHMTEEKYEQWKINVKNGHQNMSNEAKKIMYEKRRISMKGKKWYKNELLGKEQMFGEYDIIPTGYQKGRLNRYNKTNKRNK